MLRKEAERRDWKQQQRQQQVHVRAGGPVSWSGKCSFELSEPCLIQTTNRAESIQWDQYQEQEQKWREDSEQDQDQLD